MPYKNEHAARLREPEDFESIKQLWEEDGIRGLGGPLKSNGETELQALRFDASRYTEQAAREWLNEHDYAPIKFEPAIGKSMTTQLCKVSPDARLIVGKAEEMYPHGSIEGYASVWDVEDLDGDIMRRGAFAVSCRERVPAGKVLLMAVHFAHGGAVGEAIGELKEAWEDEIGLRYKAALYDAQMAQETRNKVQASPKAFGASVGFLPLPQGVKMLENGGREFTACKLYEVTITPTPANEYTTAMAKSIDAVAELRGKIEKLEQEIESMKTEPEQPEVESAPDGKDVADAPEPDPVVADDPVETGPSAADIARDALRKITKLELEAEGF